MSTLFFSNFSHNAKPRRRKKIFRYPISSNMYNIHVHCTIFCLMVISGWLFDFLWCDHYSHLLFTAILTNFYSCNSKVSVSKILQENYMYKIRNRNWTELRQGSAKRNRIPSLTCYRVGKSHSLHDVSLQISMNIFLMQCDNQYIS